MPSILRAQLISFDNATWTAVVLLDGSVAEVVMPVGQWVPDGLLAPDDLVAVLLFDDHNPDDGVVLVDPTHESGQLGSMRYGDIVRLREKATGRRVPLGHFYSPPAYTGEWRCDTHPRFSPDGNKVVIDSPPRGRAPDVSD